jgi:hypothetical protein
MIIFRICTGIAPLKSFIEQLCGNPNAEDIVKKNVRPKFPNDCNFPKFIKLLILNCWEKDLQIRKNITEQINFFKEELKKIKN